MPCSEEQKKIKEAGQEFFNSEGYKKGEYTEEDYKNLLIYCENDVRIQKENVDRINQQIKDAIKKAKGKELSARSMIYKKGTQAGLALYTLRSLIPEFNHYFPNFSDPKFDDRREFVQKCYQGGTSMFPGEMRNNPMPIGIDTGFYEIHVESLELNKKLSRIPLIELFGEEGVKKG
ncbi:5935_t:CDS:2 [Ambispora gerdemannii]|uniref:5935_t:CDS:1 n=1 Tax=Ambispora gerdemannii TaxID=144530 RepID=A0A9N8V1V2_9GLOM|nr:5935_t:CDS:2 [Ambispora gerdemannii]